MKTTATLASLALLLAVGCSSSPVALADNPAPEKKTAAAPSGAGDIVFASNRSGPWRIWTVNADGAGLRQLLDHANNNEQDVDPSFSSDRKRIVFTSTRGGATGAWIMSADAANPERLCDGEEAELSPDGKTLVFRRNEKIWIRHLADGKEKQIVPDDMPHCNGPAWSPDGKTIAFACWWDEGRANKLFLVDASGDKPPVMIYDKKPACQPHFSPDGQRLVYETETHICTIQTDGQKNRLITYWGGVQRYGRWSPDGSKIVYCQGVSEKGPWELYIVPSSGGSPTKLTEGGSDMNPDWR